MNNYFIVEIYNKANNSSATTETTRRKVRICFHSTNDVNTLHSLVSVGYWRKPNRSLSSVSTHLTSVSYFPNRLFMKCLDNAVVVPTLYTDLRSILFTNVHVWQVIVPFGSVSRLERPAVCELANSAFFLVLASIKRVYHDILNSEFLLPFPGITYVHKVNHLSWLQQWTWWDPVSYSLI